MTFPFPVWSAASSPVADAYTKLLLHFDGANGSTTFVDSSPTPKTVTAVGNAQLSTSAPKFGSAALACDGSGDYAQVASHADLDLGTGNWTIEFWQKFATVPSDTVNRYMFRFNSSFCLLMYYGYLALGNDGGNWYQNNGLSWSSNTWYHMAVVRDGSTITLYRNGSSIGTTTSSMTWGTGPIYIGKDHNGQIDDFRISVGIARWTSNFTPPTGPY